MLLEAIFSLQYKRFLGREFCIIQSIKIQPICQNMSVTFYHDELTGVWPIASYILWIIVAATLEVTLVPQIENVLSVSRTYNKLNRLKCLAQNCYSDLVRSSFVCLGNNWILSIQSKHNNLDLVLGDFGFILKFARQRTSSCSLALSVGTSTWIVSS